MRRNTFSLAQSQCHDKTSLMSYAKHMFSDYSVLMRYQNCTDYVDTSWYHLIASIFIDILLLIIWTKTRFSLCSIFELCRDEINRMAYANHICLDQCVGMRNQNRVGTIGLPSGHQSANCAYSDSLCICVDLSWCPLFAHIIIHILS